MKTFKDANGRAWEIHLTLGTVRRIRAALNIDLLQPEAGEPPLQVRMATDEMLLAEIVLAILDGQFEKHATTADKAAEAFDGATVRAANEAFYAEYVDFFLGLARPDRARSVQRQSEMMELAVQQALVAIEKIDIETLGKSFGKLPDSQE